MRRGQDLRPVGLQETAILNGFQPETAWRWNSLGNLPKPDHRLSGNPMWMDVATIEQWAAQEGKLQDALDAANDALEDDAAVAESDGSTAKVAPFKRSEILGPLERWFFGR